MQMQSIKLFFKVFLLFPILLISCYEDGFYDDATETEDEFFNDEDYDEESGEEEIITAYRIEGDEIYKIRDYEVRNDLLPFQLDDERHLKMWKYFSQLIPLQHRERITEYVVFYGGDEILGYVEPIDTRDLSKWRMGLAIDVDVDLVNIKLQSDFAYTSIHEFGHVETLNEEQIDVAGSNRQCKTYFAGEGCAIAGAYIEKIYRLGWEDIIHEYDRLDEDDYEGMEAFYEKYKDRFVTGYAATNPGEDIAEVFTHFVLEEYPRNGNTIADQKVNMLYTYPELLEIKRDIRTHPIARTLTPRSWDRTTRLVKKKIFSHTHKRIL